MEAIARVGVERAVPYRAQRTEASATGTAGSQSRGSSKPIDRSYERDRMAVSRMNVCLVERNRGRMGIDRVKNGELCLFVLYAGKVGLH